MMDVKSREDQSGILCLQELRGEIPHRPAACGMFTDLPSLQRMD